jgi:hypothetical protein
VSPGRSAARRWCAAYRDRTKLDLAALPDQQCTALPVLQWHAEPTRPRQRWVKT